MPSADIIVTDVSKRYRIQTTPLNSGGSLLERWLAPRREVWALKDISFAVFRGEFDAHAWNGALPPAACSGFPAFPYNFVEPNAFIQAHLQPVKRRGK